MDHIDQKKKKKVVFLLSILSVLGPFSVDMYLSGFPAIAHDLNTDIEHVSLSLTSYFIGISFGQLIYGPLLDRFGRKKPLTVGLYIYIAAAIGCGLSPTINVLIVQRLLLALGGCVGMVAGRAIVRDLFEPHEVVKIFSLLMLGISVSPIAAPTIGGLITSIFGWRYIFAALTAVSIFMVLGIARLLPESKEPDPSISLNPRIISAEYLKILKMPEFYIYAIASGMLSAGMFTYISEAPFIIMNLFGFSEIQFGWIFAVNAMGLVISSQLNHILIKKSTSENIVMVCGILIFITGLLLLVINLLFNAGATVVFALIFIYMFWLGILNPNAAALVLKPFTKNVGSASALLGSVQMFSGSIATAIVSVLHNGTIFPVAYMMAGWAAIFLLLLLGGKFFLKFEYAVESQG